MIIDYVSIYVTIFPYLFLYNSTQTVAFPAPSKILEVIEGGGGGQRHEWDPV